jgi:hypothetical protein
MHGPRHSTRTPVRRTDLDILRTKAASRPRWELALRCQGSPRRNLAVHRSPSSSTQPDLSCIVLVCRGLFAQAAGHVRIELLGERIAGASRALAGQADGSGIGSDAPRPAGVAHVTDLVPGQLAAAAGSFMST